MAANMFLKHLMEKVMQKKSCGAKECKCMT